MGRVAVLKSLTLSKLVYLRLMLSKKLVYLRIMLSNLPDAFIKNVTDNELPVCLSRKERQANKDSRYS